MCGVMSVLADSCRSAALVGKQRICTKAKIKLAHSKESGHNGCIGRLGSGSTNPTASVHFSDFLASEQCFASEMASGRMFYYIATQFFRVEIGKIVYVGCSYFSNYPHEHTEYYRISLKIFIILVSVGLIY